MKCLAPKANYPSRARQEAVLRPSRARQGAVLRPSRARQEAFLYPTRARQEALMFRPAGPLPHGRGSVRIVVRNYDT